MGKKKYYLTLDTETATLPFANLIANNSKEKRKIAIAKPLVYDIGWIITDTKGEVIDSKNFLVQETFFVPQVFNTAYYKEKRPIYMGLFQSGAIKALCWNDIIDILISDLRKVNLTAAYNATFDFKRAIPFTERYIKHLYSEDYTEWEKRQYDKCVKLIRNNAKAENPEYLKPYLELRGESFPIVDLWSLACDRLINQSKYKDYCLQNSLLTASAQYFKTSAETSFQYLSKQYNFVEDHTALSDAQIEAQILAKALKKGKVEPNLQPFPFRALGDTISYTREKRPEYIDIVLQALDNYLSNSNDTSYRKAIENKRDNLKAFLHNPETQKRIKKRLKNK